MAHCTNSCLLGKISGDSMIQNNLPLRLPNHYSYGYNPLAICQDDKAICPSTEEVFHFSQAQRSLPLKSLQIPCGHKTKSNHLILASKTLIHMTVTSPGSN
ncbi:hypothetical protein GH733_014814 [Mirounga leonina]|nr:hypothetical protein GH733_014814 [Mirounga leonina]